MSAVGLAVAQIVVGLIMGMFGRRVIWLFVGIAGFLLGWFIAPAIWETAKGQGAELELWLRLVIGIVVGIVAAFLAYRFTRVMVAIAGFLVVGVATVLAVRYFGGHAPNGSRNFWIAFGCGGVVGAIVLGLFFDWALIILTSLAGAGAVADGIFYFFTPESPSSANPAPARWIEGVVLAVLFIIGLVVQIKTRGRRSIGVKAT
ncbi:MAG: hypothetical protein A2Y74_08570 [Actinobacteria bacterium RBG_13_63_9]|nr:MAG: hypothetical protein A2Y74_08570 [Actinobacteria bacterium RBG_13_63_9]